MTDRARAVHPAEEWLALAEDMDALAVQLRTQAAKFDDRAMAARHAARILTEQGEEAFLRQLNAGAVLHADGTVTDG